MRTEPVEVLEPHLERTVHHEVIRLIIGQHLDPAATDRDHHPGQQRQERLPIGILEVGLAAEEVIVLDVAVALEAAEITEVLVAVALEAAEATEVLEAAAEVAEAIEVPGVVRAVAEV